MPDVVLPVDAPNCAPDGASFNDVAAASETPAIDLPAGGGDRLKSIANKSTPPAEIVPERVPGKPIRLGSLQLASRFLLAPLAGFTNLPFRLVVRRLGGLGLATTDLISARALIMGGGKSLDLAETCPEDNPVSLQLFGSEPEVMAQAAQWAEAHGAHVVDINMGCPVNKVVKGGGGSAMMCQPTSTLDVVTRVVNAVSIPVTVKMRLGWDDEQITAPEFAREFEKRGVAGITIHGRTREQAFKGSVNIEGIRRVVEAVERIPVFGNGDVRSLADAANMFQKTGCAGIAIGRGALMHPWFFRRLKSWDETGDPGPQPTYRERLQFMCDHFECLLQLRPERFACVTFRKVATWYCKVLRPGKEIQHELVMIQSAEHFRKMAARIGEVIAKREGAGEWHPAEVEIRLPSGPIAHW